MTETILVAIITSSAFTSIVNAIINKVFDKKNDNDLMKKALMCVLGYQVKHEAEKLVKQKTIKLNDYKQLQELNATYKSLGGNGYVHALMEKVESKDIEE